MGHFAALAAPGSHSPGCFGNLYDQYVARMQTWIPAPEVIVDLVLTRQELRHLAEAGQLPDTPLAPLKPDADDETADLMANIEAMDLAIVDWLVTYISRSPLLEAVKILDDISPGVSHEENVD